MNEAQANNFLRKFNRAARQITEMMIQEELDRPAREARAATENSRRISCIKNGKPIYSTAPRPTQKSNSELSSAKPSGFSFGGK